MIKTESSIIINKPVAEVFEFTTKAENNAKWQDGVIESSVSNQTAEMVGTVMTDVRQILGQKLESEVEVTAYELNKMVVMKIIKGPVKMEITQTYEAVDGGTKMSIKMEGEPGGFFKLVGGALEKQVKETNDKNFETLKKVLEG